MIRLYCHQFFIKKTWKTWSFIKKIENDSFSLEKTITFQKSVFKVLDNMEKKFPPGTMWGRGVSPGRVQSKNEGANVTKGGYGGS